jgi:hypothetical protein
MIRRAQRTRVAARRIANVASARATMSETNRFATSCERKV